MTSKKATATKKAMSEKQLNELRGTTEPRLKVELLKPYEGYKKGEVIEVPVRKVMDTSRPMKRGVFKIIEQV